MASVTFKSMNRNRLRKVYPHIRKTPKRVMISDKVVIMETIVIAMTEEDSTTYTFEETYDSTPIVTLGAYGTDGGIVNSFITNLDQTTVTIQTSSPFTGNIYVQVLYIGS